MTKAANTPNNSPLAADRETTNHDCYGCDSKHVVGRNTCTCHAHRKGRNRAARRAARNALRTYAN